MKKIEFKEDVEKRRKRNQIIIGVIMIVVLTLSSVGFAIIESRDNQTQKQSESYNGFKFTKISEGYWATTTSSGIFYFQYLPQELENVSVSSGMYNLAQYSNKPLYIVNNNVASQEIAQNLYNTVPRIQEACLSDMNCTGESANFPVKSCENDNIIVFDTPKNLTGELQTKVYKVSNCVYIEGDFTQGVDAFMYKLAGIK